MATKKIRYFELDSSPRGFVPKRKEKKDKVFKDLKILRNLLTTEKGRILYTLKKEEPDSIYQLAKILGKDLKSVRTDMKTLEKFGFIRYIAKKTGKRVAHKPILAVDKMEFTLNI